MILPPERDNLEFGSYQIKISPKIAFFLVAGLDKSVNCSVVSDSLQPHELWPTRLLCLWDFPGKNTGVGSDSLLPEIFPTQGSNLCPLHCRQILFCLSHQGSPPGLDRSYVICWKLLTWQINPGESVPPWMMSFNTELIKHKCFAPGPHKQFLCLQPEGGKVSKANICFCSAVATNRITGMSKGESVYRQEKRPEVDSPGPGHPSGLEWAIWGSTDFRCRSPICPHFLQSLHSFTQQMRDSHPEMESLQILGKSQSLSNPQKPGGSDTPQLCSIVPGKQKRTTFCVLVTVTWDRLQLLSAPSSGSRVLDLPGLCLNPCGCWVAKSCLTLFDPVDCSMPGSSVLHYLPEFAQIHAHWVGDAI